MRMVAFPSSHEKEAWLLYFCDFPPEAALSYMLMRAWPTSAQEAQQHESHTCVCARCAIEGRGTSLRRDIATATESTPCQTEGLDKP